MEKLNFIKKKRQLKMGLIINEDKVDTMYSICLQVLFHNNIFVDKLYINDKSNYLNLKIKQLYNTYRNSLYVDNLYINDIKNTFSELNFVSNNIDIYDVFFFLKNKLEFNFSQFLITFQKTYKCVCDSEYIEYYSKYFLNLAYSEYIDIIFGLNSFIYFKEKINNRCNLCLINNKYVMENKIYKLPKFLFINLRNSKLTKLVNNLKFCDYNYYLKSIIFKKDNEYGCLIHHRKIINLIFKNKIKKVNKFELNNNIKILIYKRKFNNNKNDLNNSIILNDIKEMKNKFFSEDNLINKNENLELTLNNESDFNEDIFSKINDEYDLDRIYNY